MERRLRMVQYWENWHVDNKFKTCTNQMFYLPRKFDALSTTLQDIFFTSKIIEGEAFYTHTNHTIHSMPETVAHRILRSSKKANQLLKVITFYINYITYIHVDSKSLQNIIQNILIFSYKGYYPLVKWIKRKIRNWLYFLNILIIRGSL